MNRKNFEKLLRANREAPADVFNMAQICGTPTACGTPACLLGNYALRTDIQHTFKTQAERRLQLLDAEGTSLWIDDARVCEHFDISRKQAERLFGRDGCNNAGTDLDAALAYVEHFMATGETPHDDYDNAYGEDEDEDQNDSE